MIEAHDLSRRYGDFTAVDRVSFSVDEGEIVGILGPNGAGKTTIIRMITGFLPPTGGRVTVAGKDLFDEPRQARRDIGYLPENVALYPEMRVHEYLAYRARLEGMPRSETAGAVDRAIERALLTDVRHQIIGTLSKGYRQRVGLATAILHKPRVLMLDEPTVGLDPKQIIAIRELILELGGEGTLLLSTHILPEVELLCDRVFIVDRGRIVAQGTPAELSERTRGRPSLRVQVRADGAAGGEVAAALGALPGVAAVEAVDAGWRLDLADDTDAEAADPREAVFRTAVEHGWVLLELTEERASLEDVFVRLTTDETAETLEAASPGEDVSPAPDPAAPAATVRRTEPEGGPQAGAGDDGEGGEVSP